ncbi:magnesium transporter [Puniceicoccales bacterium CK1056]|uniref:Magnesium transporter MgtE n=1 Tax=Oceanipulchritudo coccoides TaxID=2706888 RepID=A0A6B2M2X7_9BACT|nr:magnesium transporter [Oceanipulchritudo coccoides]NDV62437.1 magnesium transporter [Oceanipulchritudo coccoides]
MDTPTERQDLSYSHEELMEWPRDELSNLNPVRLAATSSLAVAQFLERLEIDERRELLRQLSTERAADILAEMDEEDAADVLEEMRPHRAARILDDFEPDDAADVVAELEPENREQLLAHMEQDSRESVEELLSYDPDSAGGLMTTEVDTALDRMTVEEATSRIREFANKHEDLHYVYVVNEQRQLRGIVSLRKLIQSGPQQLISTIMRSDIQGVCTPEMDKEEVSLLMAEHNLPDIAVVDAQNTLLGVITHDDVLDVIRDEATEDIQKLAGAGGDEDIHDDILFSIRQRQPWLAVNLGTAFIAAMVVKIFEADIGALPILAAIMPIIAGVGGNSGQQSLAITIRSIALGLVKEGDAKGILFRQAVIGLINGLLIGLLAAVMVAFFGGPLKLSIIVLSAMIINLAMGCITGTLIPLVLLKLKQDPAQVSSILLTFVTDTGGFFIFLTLGSIFLL